MKESIAKPKSKIKKPARRKKAGRPSFKRTTENKSEVARLAGLGMTEDDIATLMGIARNTLRKHFARELEVGQLAAHREMAGFLFSAAKSGNVTAQIFWAKTRMGWKEPKTEIKHSGAVGNYDLSKVSNEDLARLEAILSPVAASPADDHSGGEAEEGSD